MQINQSLITQNLPQIDGRKIVREQHLDDHGSYYYFDYMATNNADLNQHLAMSAAQLNALFKYQLDNAKAIVQAVLDDLNTKLIDIQNQIAIQTEIVMAISVVTNPIGDGS